MMKRTLLLLLISVVSMMAASASVAHADEVYNPTCGQNTGKFAHAVSIVWLASQGNGGQWQVNVNFNCGVSGTFEYEVQKSTDGGNHWIDQNYRGTIVSVDEEYTVPSSQANQNVTKLFLANADCTNTKEWRLRVWSAATDSTSDKYLNPDGHGGGNNGGC